MPDSVDPAVRLQNIALEMQELLQQRSMAWTEITNRATMLMTVVGASVFALALVGNAVDFDRSFLVFALVVLVVVLIAGLATLGRISELEALDWRWVQGLNRLRHARLEVDPQFEKYLVTSPYDDVDAVLGGYLPASANPILHGLYVLWTLIGFVNSMIAAFLAADIAFLAGQGLEVAALAGVGGFLTVLILSLANAYRSYKNVTGKWTARFPAATDKAQNG